MFFNPTAAVRRNFFAALLIGAGLFLLHYFRVLNFHELEALDLRLLLRGKRPAHHDVVLVEIDSAALEALGPWPWSDRIQAKVLEILEEGSPRLVYFDLPRAGEDHEGEPELARTMEKYANVILPFYRDPDRISEEVTLPKLLRESSRAYGYDNLPVDPDGHVRRIQISLFSGGKTLYAASVQTLLSDFRDEEEALRRLKEIPRHGGGEFWISFPGREGSFLHFSLKKLLDAGPADLEAFHKFCRNRIVLVGPVADEIANFKLTAGAVDMPHLLIQASALHTLLAKDYLREVSPWLHLGIQVLLCFLVFAAVDRAGPRNALLLGMGAAVFFVILNLALFSFQGWIFPLFSPLTAMAVTYVTLLFMGQLDMRFQGELLSRELSMAARVQATFLPQVKPESKDFQVSFECRFAKDVGGDFYDWMDLGEGRLGISVGDVSGKGVPAAIYMVRGISELRRENNPQRTPAEVLTALNQRLVTQSYTGGMFLTLNYSVVEPREKQIALCSAGHEPMIYYKASTRKAEIIKIAQGPPVGLFTDAPYKSARFPYEQGDTLLLLSDGVTELRNFKRQVFGIERVKKYLEEHARDDSADALVSGLFQQMEIFRESTPAHDDRTLLCVKFGSRF
ncbi:MAG TPA: SpoIIE family protein phosphatase [Verrucomicrobiae bacterium]|jgi:CHASE2 domain-containing sensor protein|nr:SpoIIE family protein phosphatase [Verrucomicrobiae bacterium]